MLQIHNFFKLKLIYLGLIIGQPFDRFMTMHCSEANSKAQIGFLSLIVLQHTRDFSEPAYAIIIVVVNLESALCLSQFPLKIAVPLGNKKMVIAGLSLFSFSMLNWWAPMLCLVVVKKGQDGWRLSFFKSTMQEKESTQCNTLLKISLKLKAAITATQVSHVGLLFLKQLFCSPSVYFCRKKNWLSEIECKWLWRFVRRKKWG